MEKDVDGIKEVEVNYIIARSQWGKGYATEIALALKEYASQRLNVENLIALIGLDNEASVRVATKIGMQFEKEIIRPGGGAKRLYRVRMRDLNVK